MLVTVVEKIVCSRTNTRFRWFAKGGTLRETKLLRSLKYSWPLSGEACGLLFLNPDKIL